MAAAGARLLTTRSRSRVQSIRALREWLGLSQGEFARALGVSRATVNRWEMQGHDPDPASAAGRLVEVMREIRELALKQSRSHKIDVWFTTPLPLWKGRTPRETLLARGPVPVRDALLAAWEGAYA